MNKKILAAVFSMALLCSCGNGNSEELSETGAESVSLASGAASETTVTTTAAETTSEAVSEETEVAAEVSEAEEKVPITRDFFNDDVVFEEVLLPVKGTYYENGVVDYVCFNEYDAAGNQCKIQYQYQDKTDHYITENITKYSYRPDGTYSRVSEYYNGEDTPFLTEFYDKHGYCTKDDNGEYEYQFDDAGHLTRKTMTDGGRKWWVDYTYDENGRLYEETSYYMVYGEITTQDRGIRHEYDGNIESIYYFSHSFEGKQLWKTLEKDENGNLIKETVNMGHKWGEYNGQTFSEYTYDDMNRVIYENHSVSDDFPLGLFEIGYRKEEYIYSVDYEYEGNNLIKRKSSNYNNVWEYFYDEKDRLIKETNTYDNGGKGMMVEYFYNDDGSIMSHYYAHGVLENEIEYAMIPKIVTDIEYKNYNKVNP